MGSRAAAVAATLAAVALAAGGAWKAGVVELPFVEDSSGEVDAPGVYLVALGEFPREELDRIAVGYRDRYHVPVGVLAPIPLDRESFDAGRNQLVAEKALALVSHEHPEVVEKPRTALVALTIQDMYVQGKPWEYAFAAHESTPYAVVSSARMDPAFSGLRSMPKLAESRLRKTVAREIGVIYLGLPLSRDRRSLLYGDALSPDDLDFMTASYSPKPYRAQKSNWLAGAQRACESAGRAAAAVKPSTAPSPAELLASGLVTVSVDAGLARRLERLDPVATDRHRVKALLALMSRAERRDARVLAELGESWSETTIERWRQAGASDVAAMRALSLQLGADACAAYLGS